MMVIVMLMFVPAEEKLYRLAELQYIGYENAQMCEDKAKAYNETRDTFTAADGTIFGTKAECLTDL